VEAEVKKRESVAVALAILIPVLLLGGGFAMASDDAHESVPDGGSSEYTCECQADCPIREQQSNDVADCAQYVTQSPDIECVGIGCWDPRLEPVVDVEQRDSPNTPAAADDSDSDVVTATEEPCPSCDVILVNEYPELHYR
jgi:arabinogalactan endo-1,4-beta-galactosidase